MDITLREKKDVVVFDIKGEIRRSEISEITLHQAVKDQIEVDKTRILLNLEGVEFIDSFGVGQILGSFISAQNTGGHLKLMNISQKLSVIFKVTGLDKVFEIFDEESAAIASFS